MSSISQIYRMSEGDTCLGIGNRTGMSDGCHLSKDGRKRATSQIPGESDPATDASNKPWGPVGQKRSKEDRAGPISYLVIRVRGKMALRGNELKPVFWDLLQSH